MHIEKDLVAASATPLVLGILAEGDSYGYAILKRRRLLVVAVGCRPGVRTQIEPPTSSRRW